MLEVQSAVDYWMSVRILAYTALLWQDVIRAENLKAGDSLPPVFPMVLYDRAPVWTAPTSLGKLLGTVKKSIKP